MTRRQIGIAAALGLAAGVTVSGGVGCDPFGMIPDTLSTGDLTFLEPSDPSLVPEAGSEARDTVVVVAGVRDTFGILYGEEFLSADVSYSSDEDGLFTWRAALVDTTTYATDLDVDTDIGDAEYRIALRYHYGWADEVDASSLGIFLDIGDDKWLDLEAELDRERRWLEVVLDHRSTYAIAMRDPDL
jgi:hypothetical protein